VSVNTIEGVPTSVAAFVGSAARGTVDTATTVDSWPAYVQSYGDAERKHPMSWAVRLFFLNGGTSAVVVRAGSGTDDLGRPASPTSEDVLGETARERGAGIYALGEARFAMLCIPTAVEATYRASELTAAAEFCRQRRAMLVADPPAAWTGQLTAETVEAAPAVSTRTPDVAIYYPNLAVLDGEGPFFVGPSGAVAGVWAASDSEGGVWRAPAGRSTALTGVDGLAVELNRDSSATLGPLGVNTLRTVGSEGPVLWGARTLAGPESGTDDWRYIPARRTALYIEESLDRGSRWAQFEPNDERLWHQVRESFSAFLHRLWRDGALAGSAPQDAFVVRCDGATMTQEQIDQGIVVAQVGLALARAAEFVWLAIHLVAAPPRR
jgi:phage tail sheath protein FI